MAFDVNKLVRNNIRRLQPYSSARNEFSGDASVMLDANENAFGSPVIGNYNRYPDPLQNKLKEKLADIKGVPKDYIFLGNGSDEAIDLLFRIFCQPGIDNVVLVPPTYGMYEVSAQINDVYCKKVPLTADYQLNLDEIAASIDQNTKMIFICSPNNPTGNSIKAQDIETILVNFDGIVVVDEAYINFSKQRSFTYTLPEFPNLVILQTLSKAWGLAALRLGLAFANKGIINLMNRVKPPYNINQATQEMVMKALDGVEQVNQWIQEVVKERESITQELENIAQVKKVYPSDANFILAKFEKAKELFIHLKKKGVIVRDRSNQALCEQGLRITIGAPEENALLLREIKNFYED
ncbi:MAG TPA: histidinol-phosphate transaminase [Sphingobacterium sp.]|nr:histidinol-phosphate transaminase [Sphingobacterium sp.]